MSNIDYEQKFHRLVTQHKNMLWYICSDYSLNEAWELKDAFQEILLELWRSFGTLREHECEKAWVYRVATNTMLNLCRKQKKVPTHPPDDYGDKAVEAYRQQEDYEYLLQLIDQLDEVDRLIVRSHLDGYKHSEIADRLNMSPSAVEQRYTRALKKIRKQYENTI